MLGDQARTLGFWVFLPSIIVAVRIGGVSAAAVAPSLTAVRAHHVHVWVREVLEWLLALRASLTTAFVQHLVDASPNRLLG